MVLAAMVDVVAVLLVTAPVILMAAVEVVPVVSHIEMLLQQFLRDYTGVVKELKVLLVLMVPVIPDLAMQATEGLAY
jgi:hypothetical protein